MLREVTQTPPHKRKNTILFAFKTATCRHAIICKTTEVWYKVRGWGRSRSPKEEIQYIVMESQ